jgi:hypothetical protein
MAEEKINGRPSKYKQEYDKLLVDHMASGLSYLSFAAVVNVNEDTLYEWEKVHPSFSEAKRDGFSRNRLFWEKLGVDYITHQDSKFGSSPKLNSTVWIFNMKNRFPREWRDRVEVAETKAPKSFNVKYERKNKKE